MGCNLEVENLVDVGKFCVVSYGGVFYSGIVVSGGMCFVCFFFYWVSMKGNCIGERNILVLSSK